MHDGEIDREALDAMKARGGTWAAYENRDLSSSNMGHLQFLKFGDGCTYVKPPPRYPADNAHGAGWRYLWIGTVDLDAGTIVREP